MAFDRSRLVELGVPEDAIDAVLKAHSQSVSADKGSITRMQAELDAYAAKEQEWEAQRQAGMSEQERLQAALDAAAKAQADYARKSARLDAEQVFVKAGIGSDQYASILDSIVTEDSKASVANAQAIAAIVAAQSKAASEAAVREALGSTPQPQGGSAPQPKRMTRAEWNALTYMQQVALKQENPNIMQELAN